MKEKGNSIIISGNNLELTEALKNTARDKMQKLFAHETHIQRLRIELSQHTCSTGRRSTSINCFWKVKQTTIETTSVITIRVTMIRKSSRCSRNGFS